MHSGAVTVRLRGRGGASRDGEKLRCGGQRGDALALSIPVGCSITFMGKNPAQLSQNQIDVLRWIKEGCPGGVYEQGYEHRIIARALERRGLVIISGRGPAWSATIAEAGLAWEAAPPAAVALPESEADQLIERVLEAGGRLLLPDDRDAEKTHERLIRISLRSPNRPLGKKLEMRSTGRWGYGPKEIVFAEHFDDYVAPAPVPVPERVGKYHPMVKAFFDDKEWQYVTRDHLPRAARILQAIATEAPKRGIEVLSAAQSARSVDQHRARELARAHLVLTTPIGLYGVKIRELSGQGVKKMEPRRWNERKTKPAWIENRGWEFISTGKLELVVDGPGTAYNGDHYRDAKTLTVEDKLQEVFRSFDIYRLRAEWQEREQQREKAERQRQWEAAMEQAKRRYDQHTRWEHFMERSREWHVIRQHREFLAAARPVVDSLDSVQRTDLLAQLELAERTLNEIDPIQHPELLIPDVPDPKPDELKPFLDGWCSYGPDRRSW